MRQEIGKYRPWSVFVMRGDSAIASNAHQVGGDVAGWLPLLAQTQAAIEAVEAAMRESLAP